MSNPVPHQDQLVQGRRKLKAIFGNSPPQTLKTGKLLGSAGAGEAIYRLQAGWACQFHDLANGHRAIIDVYLPGDVIGLDGGAHARPLEEVLTLTAVTIETICAKDALVETLADRSIALYLTFLLGLRQRRSDRLLATIATLDARGRVAMMLLDFYTRPRRRKLISGWVYNLPLSQVHIGRYLGLTVVHINRVLRSLRSEQIVDLEKHCVTILDLDRLVMMARNGGTRSSCATGREHVSSEAETAD